MMDFLYSYPPPEDKPVPDYDLSLISHWSYSLLTAFETCGWQVLKTRVQKEIIEPVGPALLDGREVHTAIENFFTLGRPLPKGREYLQEHLIPFASAALEPGIRMLVEHKMCLTSQLEFTEWFAKNAWLRIATDLALIGDGRMLVADWKTGKFDPEAVEQLKLNAFALFLQFPEIDEITAILVWVGKDKPHEPTPVTILRSEMWTIWQSFQIRLKPLARAFATGEWRKVPGWQCKRCPVITCELHPK
jgi:hypothetical protein